jgi:hypothetical protein
MATTFIVNQKKVMLYKHYIILSLLFSSITSCGQHIYQGVYERQGVTERFEIRTDSTFEYFSKSGNSWAYSSGNWFKSDKHSNILLLKSSYQKDSFPLFLTEINDKQLEGFAVRVEKIFTIAKDTSIWMALAVNDSILLEVNSEVVKIPSNVTCVKSLKLIFFYNNFFKPDLTPVDEYTRKFKTKSVTVKNLNANVFVLSYPAINLNMFYYNYFNNEKVIVNDKGLTWPAENSVFNRKL